MDIFERLEKGVKTYDSDNMSQNDFIDDLGISRNIFFALKQKKRTFKGLSPIARRRVLKGLELLGF